MQHNGKNGTIELKFSEDRSQVFGTIRPPQKDGEAVTPAEIIQRLNSMGVSYGYKEQALADIIRASTVRGETAVGVLIAEGEVPRDGKDARVCYGLPLETLKVPLPRRDDGSKLIDWFALDSERLVKAGDELATIVPAIPGVPGKTVTTPIQTIAPRSGRPAALYAGANVRTSDDGQHLTAQNDGLVVLHGDQLTVHGLRQTFEDVLNETQHYPTGAVLHGGVTGAQVFAGTFIAVKGRACGCSLRANGDVFLHAAEDCEIATPGNVYVFGSLTNCRVTTLKKVIAIGEATLTGGTVRAFEGVTADTLGAEDFTETVLELGVNAYAELRTRETQEELATCEENSRRIQQTLRPFVTLAVHSTLTDEKRALLQKLQAQQRTQELRIKELHNERRRLLIESKEKFPAVAEVRRTVYPGVWIRIHAAETLVEAPLEGVYFTGGIGGKTVQYLSLQEAA